MSPTFVPTPSRAPTMIPTIKPSPSPTDSSTIYDNSCNVTDTWSCVMCLYDETNMWFDNCKFLHNQ